MDIVKPSINKRCTNFLLDCQTRNLSKQKFLLQTAMKHCDENDNERAIMMLNGDNDDKTQCNLLHFFYRQVLQV